MMIMMMMTKHKFMMTMKNDDDKILKHDENEKKFGAHTHFSPHIITKVLQYYHNSK